MSGNDGCRSQDWSIGLIDDGLSSRETARSSAKQYANTERGARQQPDHQRDGVAAWTTDTTGRGNNRVFDVISFLVFNRSVVVFDRIIIFDSCLVIVLDNRIIIFNGCVVVILGNCIVIFFDSVFIVIDDRIVIVFDGVFIIVNDGIVLVVGGGIIVVSRSTNAGFRNLTASDALVFVISVDVDRVVSVHQIDQFDVNLGFGDTSFDILKLICDVPRIVTRSLMDVGEVHAIILEPGGDQNFDFGRPIYRNDPGISFNPGTVDLSEIDRDRFLKVFIGSDGRECGNRQQPCCDERIDDPLHLLAPFPKIP
jgi:hypothetical protein